MATFADSFQIIEFSKDSIHCSVECDSVGSNVIITQGNRRSLVVNVRDHKVVSDWSVKDGVRVVAPVVAHPTSGKYVGLIEGPASKGTAIRSWELESVSIDKAHKHNVHQGPAYLLTAKEDVLVVYKNALWSWLSSGSVGSQQGNPTEDIVSNNIKWCKALSVKDVIYLVLLLESQSGAVQMVVHQVSCDSSVDCITHSSSLSFDQGTPICHCLHKSAKGPSLLTLCDGGHLYSTCLTEYPFECTHLQLDTKLHSQGVSMEAIDETQIAIAGVVSTDGKVGVGILDSRFNVMQSWKQLPEGTNLQSKLCLHENQLLLCCGSGLHSFPFIPQPATIRANLGHFKQTKQSPSLSSAKGKEWLSLQEAINKVLNTAKPPSEKEFQRGMSEISGLLDTCETQYGRDAAEWLLLRPGISGVLSLCLQPHRSWPRSHLQRLIHTGLIAPRESVKLVAALSEHGELQLLGDVLHHVKHLPEDALVKVLTCFLRTPDEDFPEETSSGDDEGMGEEGSKDNPNPFSQAKQNYICQALLQPYNSVFMVESLRTMDVVHVKELLHWLCGHIGHLSGHPASRPLAMLQSVDWVSLLLDAHFAQLVLSPDLHPLLVDLHSVVSTQMEFFKELVSLEGILNLLKERCVLPPKQHIGHYCIQTLHIH